ncbi:hypothetical protein [Methanoregula sp.]|uniref:hypothetical protein n=1 Tax=Methanoregula sp. TaxID=2052170 RepID=UPI003C7943A0
MELKSGILAKIYGNFKILALAPAIAVILDYALTFYWAGDTSMITTWEASPFVRYAVIHDLMVPYLIAIVLFYYGASYTVLRILHNSEYYKFGVLLILTLSITHISGGLSWHFRNALYSNGVFVLSLMSVVISLILFGFTLLHERPADS